MYYTYISLLKYIVKSNSNMNVINYHNIQFKSIIPSWGREYSVANVLT